MRRPATLLLAATLALPAGLLAACSGGSAAPSTSASTPSSTDTATATASAADLATLDAIQVSGDPGATPTVTFDTPLSVGATVAKVDTKGTGEPIPAGAMVKVNYALFSGDDGSMVGSTWDDKTPEVIPLTGLDPVFEPLVNALVGAPLGSRIVVALPGTAATSTAEASPSSVMVLEAFENVPLRAEGTAVTPPAGLPVVTLAADGTPSISVPAGTTEPTDLVTQTLIKGAGAEVKSGDTITVEYSGWLWDGTEFDSSWGKNPFQTQIGSGSVIQGWDQGLVGQTVGSQVLLVIPPSLGYGDTEQGTIPANSTLIFVVDILAAT
ncbi:MAG: FKBP-type peptidyl-prolyl cis-trans isomerase [Actinomycetales bacterium]|nr:FKBP-type peptidyl-prolyl cis-trans isomerase [Actinomycetales bacterium]